MAENHTQRGAGLRGKTFGFTLQFDCFLFLPSFVFSCSTSPSHFYTCVLCHCITQTHHEMITIDVNVMSFNIMTTNHLLRTNRGMLHIQTLLKDGLKLLIWQNVNKRIVSNVSSWKTLAEFIFASSIWHFSNKKRCMMQDCPPGDLLFAQSRLKSTDCHLHPW